MGLSITEYEKIKANIARRKLERLDSPRPRRKESTGRPNRYKMRYDPESKSKRTADGILFASVPEKERYLELKEERAAGRVSWFIRQPLFDLAGATFKADFLVVHPDRSITVEDVKSKRMHPRFKAKALTAFRRSATQVRTLYPIEVTVIER